MGVYVLIVGAIIVGLWLLVSIPARDLVYLIRTFIAVFGALASTGLLMFGRYGIALMAIVATFLTVRSMFSRRRAADPLNDPNHPPISEVETDLLAMHMDQATGDVDGVVKIGPFRGQNLSSLTERQLVGLRRDAQDHDSQSLALLDAYLDRQFPGWRAAHAPGDDLGQDHGIDNRETGMTRDKAIAILGLNPNPTQDDIKNAHRRLMRAVHPDHGGSDALAGQINEARDFLIRGFDH